MAELVKIPVAIQLVADDFGWHNGRDGRLYNRPSRGGIPRDHAPEDCYIMNEIGKALGQKVLMPFVIGEWDKDNVLRNVKNATYDDDKWDRASEINYHFAEKYFEAAESSEYIEYAYHGLMHGFYDNGKQICETEYTRPVFDEATGQYDQANTKWLADDIIREYIDAWFRIYDSWGFKKKLRAFVCPCGIGAPWEEANGFMKVLREKGFIHTANTCWSMHDRVAVAEGVTFLNKAPLGIGWEQYDVDPIMVRDMPEGYTATGLHWVNFLRLNPENNMDNLNGWIKYFTRQSKIYGRIISKDIAFATSQALYERFADVLYDETKCTIRLDKVDSQGALALSDEFYVSTMKSFDIASCDGGVMELYDNVGIGNTVYKIKRTGADVISVNFK